MSCPAARLAGTATVTGGSLDGTGTVVGTVNDLSGGTVFAGPNIGTPGTLTVNGNYNQSGTGDLEANIGGGGTSSGVVADTGGFVNLTGGTLSVSSTPAIGSLLTVMTFGAGDLVGQFAAIQDGSSTGDGSFVDLGDGTSLEVFYNNDAGNIQIERVNNASLATTYKWTDATGNWSTAADWSGGQVPNPTANVVIGNTATGNVTLNGSSGDQTVNSLSILASNALTISGVTLTSATGGAGISVAAGASLSLASGEINGSVLSGAGLLQTVSGNSALAGDTISANTTFIGQNSTIDRTAGCDRQCGHARADRREWAERTAVIADPVTLTGGGTVTLNTIATNGGSAYIRGPRPDPDQHEQHDPGHRHHRQRQPGADQWRSDRRDARERHQHPDAERRAGSPTPARWRPPAGALLVINAHRRQRRRDHPRLPTPPAPWSSQCARSRAGP